MSYSINKIKVGDRVSYNSRRFASTVPGNYANKFVGVVHSIFISRDGTGVEIADIIIPRATAKSMYGSFTNSEIPGGLTDHYYDTVQLSECSLLIDEIRDRKLNEILK